MSLHRWCLKALCKDVSEEGLIKLRNQKRPFAEFVRRTNSWSSSSLDVIRRAMDECRDAFCTARHEDVCEADGKGYNRFSISSYFS